MRESWNEVVCGTTGDVSIQSGSNSEKVDEAVTLLSFLVRKSRLTELNLQNRQPGGGKKNPDLMQNPDLMHLTGLCDSMR